MSRPLEQRVAPLVKDFLKREQFGEQKPFYGNSGSAAASKFDRGPEDRLPWLMMKMRLCRALDGLDRWAKVPREMRGGVQAGQGGAGSFGDRASAGVPKQTLSNWARLECGRSGRLYGKKFATQRQAMVEVNDWLTFYNPRSLHFERAANPPFLAR